MGFISNLFPASSGVAHNGPQPAAPIVAAPALSVPAAAAPAAAPVTAVSHLDSYKTLWETPKNEDGTPAAIPADPLRQPVFNLDEKKILASTSKMDFTAGLNPDTLAKITAGGPDAAAAFAEALNHGIRQAVSGLSISQGQLINQALLENNQRISSSMPQQIKRAQLQDIGEDPVLSHESVAPLVTSLKQMALAKNPNASAADINAQVAGYIRGIGAAVADTSPEATAARAVKAKGETDWSNFIGE